MSTKVSNIGIIFAKVPEGLPVIDEHFKLVKREIDISSTELEKGEILIKNLYMSLDPYIRGRMKSETAIAFTVGNIMESRCIGVVVKSNNDQWKVGDYYVGMSGWEEYSKISPEVANLGLFFKSHLKNGFDNGIPLSYFLGILGMTGLTAYAGLLMIGKPKQGETIYISTAAGAVGQVAGQIAKVKGLKVVGSTGDDNKVDYLINELKFDHAFNYKKVDVNQILKETCPEGIDIYFDNVGGEVLDITLKHLNTFSRVIACGMISTYNSTTPYGIKNLMEIIYKRAIIQGFLNLDYYDHYDAFQKDTLQWLKEGKLKSKEHIVNGIENVPQAFLDMFDGKNLGKFIVKISDL